MDKGSIGGWKIQYIHNSGQSNNNECNKDDLEGSIEYKGF
jgi:hypothetical protein